MYNVFLLLSLQGNCMHEEIIKTFYRKRPDGSIGFAEISSYNYPDRDRFDQACYFFQAEGYFDTLEEAKDADYVPPLAYERTE